VEGEKTEDSSQYLVNYNILRDLIVEGTVTDTATDTVSDTNKIATTFLTEWQFVLAKWTRQFESCTSKCWTEIFAVIRSAPQARGAQLHTVLKLYTPTVEVEII